METLTTNIWQILLEAAPWLLIGLLVAGLMKALIPTDVVGRWLGGRGAGAVIRAALVGTPLPLCSCSVLPVAIALRRAGASRGATVSFLVATPENGVDSIALSYTLLGPFMTIVRPVAALISAVCAGLLTDVFTTEPNAATPPLAALDDTEDHDHACPPAPPSALFWPRRMVGGLRYAVTDLYADIVIWLSVGILLAGLVNTLVPPGTIAAWGSGLPAMLAMLLVGIPMYICATASTPVAAALLLAGVSPGTVLVFLLVGPATNIGSFGIVRQALGTRSAVCYLVTIASAAVALGLLTDLCVARLAVDVVAEAAATQHVIPHWAAMTSVVVLALMTARLVVHLLVGTKATATTACCDAK